MAIEHTLTKQQKVVRLGQEPSDDRPPRRVRRLYDDMEQGMISLTDSEERLRADAFAELQDDLRFEHLDERAADRSVWKFLCDAYVHRDEDHVGPFLQTYAREPVGTVCYFTLERLMIKEPIQIGAATLIPPDAPEVPAGRFDGFPPPCDGIVAVPVIGTGSPAPTASRMPSIEPVGPSTYHHGGLGNRELRAGREPYSL
jgi:hypothetical protein